MKKMNKFVFQSGDYLQKEKTCIQLNNDDIVYSDGTGLLTSDKDRVPVGSVEFTKQYFKYVGIREPENISYPNELRSYLHRNITVTRFVDASPDNFVKPVETKLFAGNIKKNLEETVNDDTLVYESKPVAFKQEFRYYVLDKQIIGYSRYDDGDDHDIIPDERIILNMIIDYTKAPIGYSIDVGVVNDQTTLIECNDAWSLGYYPWGTMYKQAYVDLIVSRYRQLREVNGR